MLRKRLLAFGIDYLIIISYAVILLGATRLVYWLAELDRTDFGPVRGQLIGFVSLTLPVFLYFYLSEKSKTGATIGKRRMRIRVQAERAPQVFTRNLVKLLPWEIAHFGVHWLFFYEGLEQTPPQWVWVSLVLPQLIVVAYLFSIYFSRGYSSLYDRAAGTEVIGAS